MTYKSFHISDNPHGLRIISKNGKQVFKARHLECWTLESAKQLIDDSESARPKPIPKKLYAQTACERWQLSRYGNVILDSEVQEEYFEPQMMHGEYYVYNENYNNE